MAAPWLLSLGSYAALELWAPGEVSTSAWEWFSSLVFVIAAVACVCFILAWRLPSSAKVVLSLCFGLGGVYLALSFHVHSNCGEHPAYIGQPPVQVVASCA